MADDPECKGSSGEESEAEVPQHPAPITVVYCDGQCGLFLIVAAFPAVLGAAWGRAAAVRSVAHAHVVIVFCFVFLPCPLKL